MAYRPPLTGPFGQQVRPPSVKITVDASPAWWADNSEKDASTAAGDIINQNAGVIEQFVGAQRRQGEISELAVHRRVASFGNLDVMYMTQFGCEAIHYIVRPECAPTTQPSERQEPLPGAPGVQVEDFIFDGYVMFRTADYPTSPSTVWVVEHILCGEDWVLYIVPTYGWVDRAPHGGYVGHGRIGYRFPAGTVEDPSLVMDWTNYVTIGQSETGVWEDDWWGWDVGASAWVQKGLYGEAGSHNSNPGHPAVYDIKLNGETIYTHTCSPPTGRYPDPSTPVDQIVVIPIGGSYFKARSYCDLTNSTDGRFNWVKPARKDKLLPALFPFALKITGDIFWCAASHTNETANFWTASAWNRYSTDSSRGWRWACWGWNGSVLAPGYGPQNAPGMGGCQVGVSVGSDGGYTLPKQVVITAPVVSLKLVNNGQNTIGVTTSDGVGNAEIYVEFFDRDFRNARPVSVGFRRVRAGVLVNDKPRYWYGDIQMNFGLSVVANPFTFTLNGDPQTDPQEVVPDDTVTVPDPKKEPV
jgi:hypothetical protein